jgi:hypothetical protein
VPTTAPAHYVEKAVDANGVLQNDTNIINLTGATNIGDYVLAYAYRNTSFPANTQIDLSSLTILSNEGACQYMFYRARNITSVDLSNLSVVSGNSACGSMFAGSSLTSVNLSSLSFINNQYACNRMFEVTLLTSIDLSGLTQISQNNACSNMFQRCLSLTNVDISSLNKINASSGCYEMFNGCTALQNIVFCSLTDLATNAGYCMSNCFESCTSLVVSFPSITNNSFGTNTNQFSNIFYRGTNCTIHFPSNVQAKIETLSTYPNFGGTNTTVLFDLPATNTLTGADTNTYSRNPKYDTATALAWKVGAYGTTNFDPAYYTSGTTDPTVGTTIYSDSACTTAVTTISSIA